MKLVIKVRALCCVHVLAPVTEKKKNTLKLIEDSGAVTVSVSGRIVDAVISKPGGCVSKRPILVINVV